MLFNLSSISLLDLSLKTNINLFNVSFAFSKINFSSEAKILFSKGKSPKVDLFFNSGTV